MVEFPETAQKEWQAVADAARASIDFKERLKHAAAVDTRLERMRVDYEAKILLQAEIEGEATPDVEMMTLADFTSNPSLTAPQDLIEGVLKDNSTLLVLGPSESGKSTAGMQMIYSLQTGADWMGQPTKPLSGGFGIMSYDMDASMLAAMLVKYPNIDLRSVSIVNAHKRGNPLGVPEQRAKIVSRWKAMNVEVVIIDSFSASFFGHDQNDAAATMAHYRALQGFSREVGARVLIVIVHSTEAQPDKVRGSTVHHDVADSIVAVYKTDPKDPMSPRHIRMVKYRAAPGQHQMSPVIVGAPDPTTHLIDLDTGSMTMNGLTLPPSAVAMAFPDTHEAPDTTTSDDLDGLEEDDL